MYNVVGPGNGGEYMKIDTNKNRIGPLNNVYGQTQLCHVISNTHQSNKVATIKNFMDTLLKETYYRLKTVVQPDFEKRHNETSTYNIYTKLNSRSVLLITTLMHSSGFERKLNMKVSVLDPYS